MLAVIANCSVHVVTGPCKLICPKSFASIRAGEELVMPPIRFDQLFNAMRFEILHGADGTHRCLLSANRHKKLGVSSRYFEVVVDNRHRDHNCVRLCLVFPLENSTPI